MTSMIPLNQLLASPRNVRKSGGASIEDLCGSIAAHGLLQNLAVSETAGKFYVVAGNRRLQALQRLAKEGTLKDNHPVPCKVLTDKEAAEASLAENVVRQAMHPADEFDAFRALADGGLAIGEIATRFGTSEKHVEQRLRLANVAPELLALFRDGKANLEQMMALAIVEDHAAQVKAWGKGDRQPNDWARQPKQLREALVEKDIALDSSIGRFVGLEAYKAAGGEPRQDLFSDFATLPDSKLVNKIALEKLEAEAEKLRKAGWGWVEARLTFDYSEQHKYKARGGKPDPKLGAIVTLDRWNGTVEKHTGLVKPGAKAPPAKAGVKKVATSSALSREEEGRLQALRTIAVRDLLRECRWTALALVAGSLAADVFEAEDFGAPVDNVIGIGGITHGGWSPAGTEVEKLDLKGKPLRKEWIKRITSGAKKHGGIVNWLLVEGEATAIDLIAYCATEGFIADDDVDDVVHDMAKLIDVDWKRDSGFKLTADWLTKQSKGYILAELTKVVGADTAKALAKLTAADLVKAALPRLEAADWMPEPLRAPAPKVEVKPAKKAAKRN